MKKNSIKFKKKSIIIEGIEIKEELLNKYLTKKELKTIKKINDLSVLKKDSEKDIKKILNQMLKTNQFFKYSSSILININPGPNLIKEYLNLSEYLKISKKEYLNNLNPHLYSFIFYVHQTMIKEDCDQCINLIGNCGSGKTFNVIHIIEYFCKLHSPLNYENEIFNLIQKSFQLIHIFSGVFREENYESNSNGILLRFGFNENHKICFFDLDSKILDLSLPFSENGRSFNILHAFVKGASKDLRKKFNLGENEESLSFFRKILKKFDFQIKERLNINDLEIWNKLFKLFKFFQFNKNEIVDLLNCLILIFNLNEVIISKKKNEFVFNEGKIINNICENLNINIEIFKKIINIFPSNQNAKNFLMSFMKQIYYIIFEYILNKIKDYLKSYFINLSRKIVNKNNRNFFNSKIKFINILDFPGQIKENNLGGLNINIFNECFLMFSSEKYYKIIEKLFKDGIVLNNFLPLNNYKITKIFLDENGIFDYFDKNFSEENFFKLKQENKIKKYQNKIIKFNEQKDFSETDFNFKIFFSNLNVVYNFQNLFLESQNFKKNEKINNIFLNCNNSIIKSTFKEILINKSNNFSDFIINNMKIFFDKLENISPFLIYIFHSENDYKIFFNNKNNQEKTIKIELDSLKNSLILPSLKWENFGFKEWMLKDSFINEFCFDFEKLKDQILYLKNEEKKIENFKNLDKNNIIKITLNVLCKENDYKIGNNFIIMKKGLLKKIRNYLNSMIINVEELNKKISIKPSNKNTENFGTESSFSKKNKSKILKTKTNSSIKDKKISPKTKNKKSKSPNLISLIPLPKSKKFEILNEDNSKRFKLKSQFIVNIIEKNKIINNSNKLTSFNSIKYNLFKFIHKKEINKNSIIFTEDSIDDKIIINNNNYNNNSSLFYDKNSFKNKFNINDFSENVHKIIFLQSHIRKMIGKNYYFHLEFLMNQIILIQKFIRSFLSYKKFKFFMNCYKKIKTIQKFYKNRFKKITKNSILIQSFWRKYKKYTKIQKKLNDKKNAELNNENWSFNNESFDEFNKENYKIEQELKKIKNNNNNNLIYNNKNMKFKRRKSEILNFEDYYEILNKKIKNQKIIKEILQDKNLMNENYDYNNYIYKKRLLNEIESKNNLNKKNLSIEERLINYGKEKKILNEKKFLENLEKENKENFFNPKINKNNYYSNVINNKLPFDFIKRSNLFELYKQKNLQDIEKNYYSNNSNKKKVVKKEKKPSEFSKNIKNIFETLYREEKIKKKKIKNYKKNKINSSLEKRRSSLKSIGLFNNFSARNLRKSKNLTKINLEKRKSTNNFFKDNLNEKKEMENLFFSLKNQNKSSLNNISNINEEENSNESNSKEFFDYWPNF